MLLGSRLTNRTGAGEARLYSDYPFPWRPEEGIRDEFEREALLSLRRKPSQPYYQFEERNGGYVLRYATADTMREACVGCHNSHPSSPKTDWAVGDVRGVLEIITPLDDAVAQTSAGIRSLAMLFLAIGVVGLGAGCLVIVRLRHDATALQSSNERLAVERTRAENASEAKGQFLAHMSHEIRTPLQRRNRHERNPGRDKARSRAGRPRPHGPHERHGPAEHHQRHPRLLEDRGGKG
jgi:signal transduction histidine kinase